MDSDEATWLTPDVLAHSLVRRALQQLPEALAIAAIAPVRSTRAVEPSLCAERLRGFDAHGRVCFYRHRFMIASVDLDSEDQPYVRVSLAESVLALRTQTGQWLCRTQRHEPERTTREAELDSGFVPIAAAELPR